MAGKQIVWDKTSERLYRTGVDRVVLFPQDTTSGAYGVGVGWNGVTQISESPDGGDATAIYANNNLYLNLVAKENFKGSITAYTYPKEWEQCDGSASVLASSGDSAGAVKGLRVTGQQRTPFGLAYRTLIGNDTKGTDHGYEIHLVYNATAGVSSQDYQTVNDSPEALELSWDFSTLPIDVPGAKPSAHLVISSLTADAAKLRQLETKLYGTDTVDPALPLPQEVISILGGVGG
ncbi:hypothetical protein [Aureimonas psammosilenae]|uniref:hypothetical protein n=1 Tax=Aureimonas psammosilenae TaxID=2495496 RepID=UPI0012609E62|nr:hypothetical protein [Aureimonas psammosilenae]